MASKTSPNALAILVRWPLKSSVRFCAAPSHRIARLSLPAAPVVKEAIGKAPVFHTNDPGQFRDALEMTDAEISDRLAVLRGLLLEHGIDPMALPSPKDSSSK